MVFSFMPEEAHTRGRIIEASLPSVTKEKREKITKKKKKSTLGQKARAQAAKPEDLSVTPRIYMVGENPGSSLTSISTL